ncbi:MAG TPA: acyloxyacyl hydrolase [Gammaproteobacteria bacterium]|jgi:hypothetical protein|nr:acyloxyacyl hydrolase [Gammaproteobacteria bacterium]
MNNRLKFALFALFLTNPILALANQPSYGANFSLPVYATEPKATHGYQFMLNYDPDAYQWRQFNVYFDGGFSHFYVNTAHNSTINIYSMAPVIRYTFKKHWELHPYLELSVGLAYLNQTRLENRNLGIHFAFQDRMGVGTLIGSSEKLSFGVHAVHYSNAHLSDHNQGISIPLVLDVGYRF